MRAYLEACVDYIEKDLDQPLTLDEISRAIGFSKYYLNAMFSTYTGMSLMQYARKRKIHRGLILYCEGLSLAVVAESLGYSSERAFSRAVVNDYGKSPSYFKSKGLPPQQALKIYPLNLTLPEDLLEKPVPTTQNGIQRLLNERGVKAMYNYLSAVSYEILPSMTVISGVAFGSEPEDEIIGRMNRLATSFGIEVTRQFGFDVPVESDRDAMDYRGYEYWLVVSKGELNKLSFDKSHDFVFEGSPMTTKEIPSFRYATLTIQDPMSAPFERIPGGWRALTAWLEERDFKNTQGTPPLNAQCLEEVIDVPSTETNSGPMTVMRIYIPVG